MTTITTARDLGTTIRDITGDASITDTAARDLMHAMGLVRYDELATEQVREMAEALADRE
jgi:hypothetical protein